MASVTSYKEDIPDFNFKRVRVLKDNYGKNDIINEYYHELQARFNYNVSTI